MHLPPAPVPHDLFPPLLACLPTTFVSPRPPPALLPLLAPILRQRVNFLASSGTPSKDGWIRLLCWDPERAAKLTSVVENLELEPHPVSGEIEIDDVRATKYRRLDTETLHSRLEADQFGLLPVYVWCESDAAEEDSGPGWKLIELKSLEDVEDEHAWSGSISQANDSYDTQAVPTIDSRDSLPQSQASQPPEPAEDDADYWASYDQTPAQTPAEKPPPAPSAASNGQSVPSRGRSRSEVEYFARYGTEVQPALDAHDPDEEHPELGQSTLNGTQQLAKTPTQARIDEPNATNKTTTNGLSADGSDDRPTWQKALYPRLSTNIESHDSAVAMNGLTPIDMPRPISPASSAGSVEKLEEQAARMGTGGDSRLEAGVRQHIATDVKSLFRLARSVGMDREEFSRLVDKELDAFGHD